MSETIRSILNQQIDKMFSIEDLEYRLFLQDHKKELIDTAETVILSPNEMNQYKFRPWYFLLAKKHPPAAYWILLWLNNLTGPMEFVRLSTIYVPNFSVLEQLYTLYRTLSSELSRASRSLKR
jgi:hypothetical protein